MEGVRNLADLVRRAAARRGDRPALRSHDRVTTWSEVDAQVDALAAGLRAVAPPGGRVAIVLPNVPEFATVFFGALRAGLVAVPVSTAYTPREIRHVLGDSGAIVLVATAAIVAALADDAPTHTYTLEDLETLRAPAEAAEAGSGGEDLAVLLYTSGTVGAPKGAMLSHRALIANHDQVAAIEPTPISEDDVVLLTVPMFHAYGLNSGLGAVAYHGACGVLIERFDPADTLAVIERHRVTAVIGVPPMFVAWSLMGDGLARAWAGVRIAVCGAAPLDPAAAARFREAAGGEIQQGYGLTEAAPVVTSTLVGGTLKPGSIGRPLPGIELRLIDAGGVEVVADNEDFYDFDDEGASDPGEIVVRGANLFSGYWPGGADGPDDEGWWATGDVAYHDTDGDLFIVDRLGELILVSGFNVYPAEIETVLDAHPAVVESAVIGVAHPYTGQTVKAFVVRASRPAVTVEELLAHCERQLARFKCPTAIEFVAELPHSAIGKIRKAALR